VTDEWKEKGRRVMRERSARRVSNAIPGQRRSARPVDVLPARAGCPSPGGRRTCESTVAARLCRNEGDSGEAAPIALANIRERKHAPNASHREARNSPRAPAPDDDRRSARSRSGIDAAFLARDQQELIAGTRTMRPALGHRVLWRHGRVIGSLRGSTVCARRRF
jgi:hypothetical protein